MTLFVKYETTSLLYDVFQYLYTSVNFSLHINELLFAIFFRLIEWIYIYPKMKLVKDRKIELLIEPHSV